MLKGFGHTVWESTYAVLGLMINVEKDVKY